jgi:hypothetical protein
VGSTYNDKFYAFLTAPVTTGGAKRIINFTSCRDQSSSSYYDFIDPVCEAHPYDHCCYIAINTALSECCWYPHDSLHAPNPTDPPCPQGTWTTDISGTGFSCAGDEGSDNHTTGSSTGWLITTWNIEPGETFTLTFHIHDTADDLLDSEVILDNFTWYTTPVTPGTEPID